jgi:hypothetical protein
LGGAHARNRLKITGAGVAAIHALEDVVGTGLHGQMQKRHQAGQVAMRGDEASIHVAGMTRGVAQPGHPG